MFRPLVLSHIVRGRNCQRHCNCSHNLENRIADLTVSFWAETPWKHWLISLQMQSHTHYTYILKETSNTVKLCEQKQCFMAISGSLFLFYPSSPSHPVDALDSTHKKSDARKRTGQTEERVDIGHQKKQKRKPQSCLD